MIPKKILQLCLVLCPMITWAQNLMTIEADVAPIKYNNMIFGHFIEHFDTQVYGGIYDPESKFADEDGFRTDVIEALKQIKTPIVRWPGGCFVSGGPQVLSDPAGPRHGKVCRAGGSTGI